MRLRVQWLVWLAPLVLGKIVCAQEPEDIPCLDTLAITSPQVLIGKIAGVRDIRSKDWHIEVDVVVERQLKGLSPAPSVTIVVEYVPKITLASWRDANSRVLFFYGYARTATSPRYGPNAINLSSAGLKVLTADMQVLTDAEKVVRATEDAIQGHTSAGPVPTTLFWLTDEAARSLGHADQAHCFCVAEVPVDAGLEKLARSELTSASPVERENGARMLANFQHPRMPTF